MDSFIFKGKSSKDFKIIINSLPTISKPPLRVEEIEIDGVDGARYEELGYGCYEKKIKITITDDNIDSLIDWLKGEGDLILSNEPDKYYNAKIIEQIDFERLMKYEPTEIKFRVQPFKYQYNEEKVIAKTGSVEGTEIKISNLKAVQLQIDGRSSQKIRSGVNQLNNIATSGISSDVEFTVNEDKSVLVNGTAIDRITYNLSNTIDNIYGGKYLKGSPNGASANGYCLIAIYYDENWKWQAEECETGNGLLIKSDYPKIRIVIFVKSGITVSDLLFKPMIVDSLDMEYEAYGIQPSPDYASEIVSIGKYNEDTNKYEMQVESSSENSLESIATSNTIDGVKFMVNKDKSVLLNGTATNRITYNLTATIDNVYGGKYLKGSPNGASANGYCLIAIYYDENWKWQAEECETGNGLLIKSDYPKIRIIIFVKSGTIADNIIFKPMIVENVDNEYQPYQKNTLLIELDHPLRSLPNGVKDMAYIKNNRLYVDRYVGSVVFDGSEEIGVSTSNENFISFFIMQNDMKISSFLLSNYFTQMDLGYATNAQKQGIVSHTSLQRIYMTVSKSIVSDLATFKTWLSEHLTQVDYELAEPYTEEYGDLTILNLVDGENNISNSEDANMIIDYIETLNVNNLGNHTAKPIFEIEGLGKVDFILNNSNVFSYNFDDDDKVVIDSEKEDAYLESVLKNRNMNGDFPIFNPGENKFIWDGLIKNISVYKKSRWL